MASASQIKSLVEDPGTFATVLYAVCRNEFGDQVHGWEPEMFELEFRDLGAEMPSENQDKINGLILAITEGSFYTDPVVFGGTCEALNGGGADFDIAANGLLPAEMAWGVSEVALADSDLPQWSDDVGAFAGVVLVEHGFVSAPEPLGFAQMPEAVYMGSTPGPEARGDQVRETEHAALIARYLDDQLRDLSAQIAALPWATDRMITEAVVELQAAF